MSLPSQHPPSPRAADNRPLNVGIVGATGMVGELMRTIGFAAAPGLLQVFAVFPGVTVPVFVITWLWIFAATVMAVQHALDHAESGRQLAQFRVGRGHVEPAPAAQLDATSLHVGEEANAVPLDLEGPVIGVRRKGAGLRQHRRESAEIRYKQASDSGHLAFEQGDFGKARSEFDEALIAAEMIAFISAER